MSSSGLWWADNDDDDDSKSSREQRATLEMCSIDKFRWILCEIIFVYCLLMALLKNINCALVFNDSSPLDMLNIVTSRYFISSHRR
jgi:hypothetical protein